MKAAAGDWLADLDAFQYELQSAGKDPIVYL
jgi:hypothetical protein